MVGERSALALVRLAYFSAKAASGHPGRLALRLGRGGVRLATSGSESSVMFASAASTSSFSAGLASGIATAISRVSAARPSSVSFRAFAKRAKGKAAAVDADGDDGGDGPSPGPGGLADVDAALEACRAGMARCLDRLDAELGRAVGSYERSRRSAPDNPPDRRTTDIPLACSLPLILSSSLPPSLSPSLPGIFGWGSLIRTLRSLAYLLPSMRHRTSSISACVASDATTLLPRIVAPPPPCEGNEAIPLFASTSRKVKPQPLPLIACGGHDDEDYDESGGGIRQLRLLLLQPFPALL